MVVPFVESMVRMVNLATLRQVGELLVDIHGQHDSQELNESEKPSSFT